MNSLRTEITEILTQGQNSYYLSPYRYTRGRCNFKYVDNSWLQWFTIYWFVLPNQIGVKQQMDNYVKNGTTFLSLQEMFWPTRLNSLCYLWVGISLQLFSCQLHANVCYMYLKKYSEGLYYSDHNVVRTV